MDIAGIWKSLQGMTPLGAGERPEKPEPAEPIQAKSQTKSLSPQSQAALQDILSRYDVTNIAPRDFSQLLKELQQTGAISSADQEELALVRLDLDEQGVNPDDPMNLVDFLSQRLEAQQRELRRLENKQDSPPEQLAALQSTLRQIDWIQKFALIHHTSDYQPLDVAA